MNETSSGTEVQESLSRRSFLDVLLGGTFVGTGAVFAGSVLNYLWPRQHGSGGTATQLEVGDEKDLPVGRLSGYQPQR